MSSQLKCAMGVRLGWGSGPDADADAGEVGRSSSPPEGVAEEEAAVDGEDGPGDVIGRVGGEERGRLADVRGRPQPAPGHGRTGRLDRVVAERLVLARGVDPAGLDQVDVDPV